MGDPYIWLVMNTGAKNVADNEKYVCLCLNELTGQYEQVLNFTGDDNQESVSSNESKTEWYPTEWYCNYMEAYDKYGNVTHMSDMSNYYFYLEKDGTCVIPTYDTQVFLLDEEEYIIDVFDVELERFTSLDKIFLDGIPKPNEKEGFKFVGWGYNNGNGTTLIVEDGMVVVNVSGRLDIVPMYEKVDEESSSKPEGTEKPEEIVKPEGTEKPEEPTVPEHTVEKLESETIAQSVEKITQAKEGETLVISMKKENGQIATEVPVEILEAAKQKDIDIVLDMGEYSWTINGKDIKGEHLSSINLEVTLDTKAIPSVAINTLANGEPTRQLSLTHNGDFGFKASLTINLGKEHEGEFGNLYYYDSTGKLVFMNAGKIDKDGNVTLDFSHASDYVVVVGENRTTQDNPQDSTQDKQNAVTSPGTYEGISLVWYTMLCVAIFVAVQNLKKDGNTTK